MNTYEEAKRILSELSLENIALRRQIDRLTGKRTNTSSRRSPAGARGHKGGDDLGTGSEGESLEVKARQFAALVLSNSPSLVHFFCIVVTCYLWGRWGFPFWLVLVVAVPWLEIIKSTDSERLANKLIIERYLRRLLIVDDDQYTIGDTAAWLNRAMVRLWPNAIEPMVSEIVLENVQFIFDEFLKTQSVIKRLKVESVSLGEIPLRILRIRTSLPEEHVAVTKKKAGKASSKKYSDFSEDVYSEKQHMAFDHLLEAFQKGFEISAGLLEKLPFFLHISKLSLEGTVRIRLSNLTGAPPYVGMLGITLPTLPDLDFQIRPVSKLFGDITQMPLINQIGDLVKGALTVLALPNVLEVPLAEMSAEEPDEKAAAVKIINVDTGKEMGVEDAAALGEPKVKLDIEILRAYNLAAADRNLIGKNTSDPFVVINVGHKRAKTKVKRMTCNPKWNEQFTFLLQNLDKPVKLSVFDHDIVGKNTLLGSAVVDLEALFDGTAHMLELDLSSVEYGQRGTLNISLEMFNLGLLEDDEEFEEAMEQERSDGVEEDEEQAGPGGNRTAEPQGGSDGSERDSSDDAAPGDATTRESKKSFEVQDVKAALNEEGDELLPRTVSRKNLSSPPASPAPPLQKTKTLSRQNTISSGTYTGPLTTRGGYFKNQIKERYCVLANEQLVIYKDLTCSREFMSIRITPGMEIIGLGSSANGFPVQIQDANKIMIEMWLKDDAERQKLTKALESCTKV
ncbi:hypothetical protein HOP50_10g57810 [Chloropicon primus]|nr:hypothetical protein HOP50_10g57810 [Chloropicon primus]